MALLNDLGSILTKPIGAPERDTRRKNAADPDRDWLFLLLFLGLLISGSLAAHAWLYRKESRNELFFMVAEPAAQPATIDQRALESLVRSLRERRARFEAATSSVPSVPDPSR